MGGIVGLFWRVLVGRQAWLAMALSCSTAIAAMEMTSLQYPPGRVPMAKTRTISLLALDIRPRGLTFSAHTYYEESVRVFSDPKAILCLDCTV